MNGQFRGIRNSVHTKTKTKHITHNTENKKDEQHGLLCCYLP